MEEQQHDDRGFAQPGQPAPTPSPAPQPGQPAPPTPQPGQPGQPQRGGQASQQPAQEPGWSNAPPSTPTGRPMSDR